MDIYWQTIKEFCKKNKKFLLIGVAVALVMGVVFYVSKSISVTNEGNKKEADLNSMYLDNQNVLSDCVIRIRETAGVVKGQTAALDKIITDAVKGRYDEGSSARPVGGQFISALVEEYPDLNGLNGGFDNLTAVVNGCRTDFRGYQSLLLDKISAYKKWLNGSATVRWFGDEFPSNNLEARIGNNVKYGKEALNQMLLIVTVEGNDETFESGNTKAEDPFGTNTTG